MPCRKEVGLKLVFCCAYNIFLKKIEIKIKFGNFLFSLLRQLNTLIYK
jgi:hypothetical protein